MKKNDSYFYINFISLYLFNLFNFSFFDQQLSHIFILGYKKFEKEREKEALPAKPALD